MSQDPSATAEARQIAEQRFAAGLYRLGLRAASRSLFAIIADNEKHAGRAEAFPWLARLASELPEATDLGPSLSKYPEPLRAAALAELSLQTQWRVAYLLGLHEYNQRNHESAIARFEKARGGEAARAQMMVALCHVLQRKSAPAVEALTKAEELASATPDDPEARRLRNLAVLTRARVYYSAAIRKDEDRKMIVVTRRHMIQALRDWSLIEASSAFSIDAQWERAWGHLAMGAPEDALRDLRAVLSSPGAYLPEAEQLEASVRWSKGEKEAARQSLQRFTATYRPIRAALQQIIDELERQADPDAASVALLERATEHPDNLPPTVRGVVMRALKNRQMTVNLEYARVLAAERKLLDALSQEFRSSAAGDLARNALEDEERASIQRSGQMVRFRLLREIDELDALLQEGEIASARARK